MKKKMFIKVSMVRLSHLVFLLQGKVLCFAPGMKWLEVFLFPPGWDASPSQGYLQHLICQYLFIHLSGYWGTVRVKYLARLLEIEKKYKNQITGYLHRLPITFKMYNNVFWFQLEHCFQITLYKMKSLNEFTILTTQSKIDT